MVREIITLNIGGCGIEFGESVGKRYCDIYQIEAGGTLQQKHNNPTINKFFQEDSNGTYFGRNLFCDLDVDTVNSIKSEMEYDNIMPNINNSIFGKEDGANIFSRGYNADDVIDPFFDKLRRTIDDCDNIQGFMVNHSITGAAGSGLTAQILERIGSDYRRKCKMGFEVCPIPSGNKDCNVLDPYNMAISMHKLLDHSDVSVMFDNKALHKIIRNNLNIYDSEHHHEHLNEIISKCITKITYPLRDDDYYRLQDLDEYQSHYVPFPRLHFLTPSMSPIKPKYHPITLINGFIRESYSKSYKIYNDIRYLLYDSYIINEYKTNNVTLECVTENVLNPNNFLMDFPNFNVYEDLYMSCFIDYTSYDNKQGIESKDARNMCFQFKRRKEKLQFVEWIPSGLECMFHETETKNNIGMEVNDVILNENINCCMLCNNTYFGKWCNNRISKPFNLLFDKRAFVHWFYDNKFEEGDLLETKEDLLFLQRDFNDVLAEEDTEDEDEYDYDQNDYVITSMTEQQMIDQAINNSLQ